MSDVHMQVLTCAACLLSPQVISQQLTQEPAAPDYIRAENAAVFKMGLLGTWRVGVEGWWRDNGDGSTAQVRSIAIVAVYSGVLHAVVVCGACEHMACGRGGLVERQRTWQQCTGGHQMASLCETAVLMLPLQ